MFVGNGLHLQSTFTAGSADANVTVNSAGSAANSFKKRSSFLSEEEVYLSSFLHFVKNIH